jgi:hypothetical protein
MSWEPLGELIGREDQTLVAPHLGLILSNFPTRRQHEAPATLTAGGLTPQRHSASYHRPQPLSTELISGHGGRSIPNRVLEFSYPNRDLPKDHAAP